MAYAPPWSVHSTTGDGNYTGTDGVEVEVWELYRKRAVKHGLRTSAYFRKDNFKRVFPAREV